jgi:glycosyltransferase involved in cell wall biosynthesis
MEVPCITTNLVNNAIGAKDDSAIILADDANAFVKKIESLLDNPTEIQRIGIAGKEFVKDNYSWEHYVKPLEECFGFVSGD